jgi:two-component system, NtrC family, sensor kinase
VNWVISATSVRDIMDRKMFAYLPGGLTAMLAAVLLVTSGTAVGLAATFVAFLSLSSAVLSSAKIMMYNDQKICLDRQLIQSQKLAAIGELSSGIAHEINNPLAIISQEVELLQHLVKDLSPNSEPLADVIDSLQEISHQVNRCREITHKLLDFARKSEPLIQMVDLNRLVEDMVRLVEIEAGPKNIRIEREYLEELPVAWTDPPLLRQVVLNLLNNAAYAVGRDGAIKVRTRAHGKERLVLEVSDTGCGIPPENAGKIFDPFFTTKPPGKGTGLGLSICHNIVSRLGGKISMESEAGRGSTFSVELPAKPMEGEL